MSILSRFEAANLTNMEGERGKWDPKIRHVHVDTYGRNTLINITNGGGKTTLCIGIIGLLSRQMELTKQFKERLAPVSTGTYSHLRVELLIPSDTVGDAGQRPAGDSYVFGLYGNSGEQGELRYYLYPGELADVPVMLDKNTLRSSADFYQQLKMRRGVRLQPTRAEWIDAVSQHIARDAILNMARIQSLPGEDKAMELYKVQTRKHGDYDRAFFLDVLAPLLLSGLMDAEGEEDEHTFEDTVLKSLKGIFRARQQTERKRAEIAQAADGGTGWRAAKVFRRRFSYAHRCIRCGGAKPGHEPISPLAWCRSGAGYAVLDRNRFA